MHDGGKILTGLAVFLAIVTLPLWFHAVQGAQQGAPEFKVTTESRECVEETSYMRSSHMNLLDDWREQVVRDGERIHVGLGGKTYERNLSATCIMSCHSNREEFCDRCHGYVGVEPYCWDCHAQRGGAH